MRNPFDWSTDFDSDEMFEAMARRTLAEYGERPASEWTLVESLDELERPDDDIDLEPAI
jgi:hypothetical protein